MTQWEVERRKGQEQLRGVMRVIVRAWREEADGRRARALRSATDKHIEAHARTRTPTDVLTSEHTSFRPRGLASGTPEEERAKWDELCKQLSLIHI